MVPRSYDYGAIILPTDLGSTTGWFGFGVYADATLTSSVGNISGYPGDKPSGTQWYAARTIASVKARKVFYDIDTAGGQCGSAVYRIVNGNRYARRRARLRRRDDELRHAHRQPRLQQHARLASLTIG